MTDQERNQVLKMIEDGKISPEEGLKLMQALEQSPAEEDRSAAGDSSRSPRDASGLGQNPHLDRLKSSARQLWQIPLWIGVSITLFSALGMYLLLRGPGIGFWFYFLTLPLLVGVLLIALGVGSRTARWLFVDVRGKPGEGQRHIFLGFPLPLKLAAWLLRTFGSYIPDLKKTNVDEVIEILSTGLSGDEPLVVNVDQGDGGEKVRVYIG
jgi:hypothetical protein